MSSLKILTAIAAAATVSLAFAQGVPPRPAADPAVGAGQRSTQNTPMGTTGTPGNGAMAQGSAGASGAAATTAGSATMGGGTTMHSGATAGSGTSAMSGGTHHAKKHKKHKRVKKADRN